MNGTSLNDAVRAGNLEAVTALLDSGADINGQDDGGTALMIASAGDYTEIIQRLLMQGANVNIVSKMGDTALLRAIENSNLQVVRVLLEYGADVNACDTGGWTPLINTVYWSGEARHIHSSDAPEYRDIAKLLIDFGAEVNAQMLWTRDNGKTSLDLALRNSNLDLELVQLLKDNGGECGFSINDKQHQAYEE